MVHRFGDFELNEEEFSLSRDGTRVPLEPRALGVLTVLASNPGKLMTKQTLLQAVWKDTFVEETTLTRAIAIIRKQLGDDARVPIYIETVPTKGYRFIAPINTSAVKVAVEQDSLSAATDGASEMPPAHEAAHHTPQNLVSAQVPAPATRLSKASLWTATLVGSLALILVAGMFSLGRSRHRLPQLTTRDTIVLGSFVNTTGDAAFDVALRQGLLVELEQSPVLRLASEAQIRGTLKRMGRGDGELLSAAVAQEVCQRLGGSGVLDGSITRLGSSFVIGLRARQCSTGEEISAEQVQVERKEDALHAISQIATHFRSRLGEAAGSLGQLHTPLAEATTPSLEALNAFSRGMQAFNTKGSRAAIPLFRYATQLDPDFAWAHAWLGRMYADLGQEDAAIESTRRAHELRDRASERERFTIDVSYDLLVTGDLQSAREACEAWLQMYPQDVYPRAFLSTTIYPAFGQYERALTEAKDMMALDPDFVVGYRNAAVSLIALNRADEARSVLREAAERKVFLPSFVVDSYRIAFLKGDAGGMEQALRQAPGNPWLWHYHAATLARAGRSSEARVLEDRALTLARQSGRQDTEAELLAASAFMDLFDGQRERSTQAARQSLKLKGSRYAKASAALVLAMAGHSAEASACQGDLQRAYPQDTLLRLTLLPSIQAAIALDRGRPQDALDLLQAASRSEMRSPLYPTYLRGQAQLALGRGTEAAATLRTIVERPGVVLNDPLWKGVQQNLAKANALSARLTEGERLAAKSPAQWTAAANTMPVLQPAAY